MVKILAVSVLVVLSVACAKDSDSSNAAAPAPAPAQPGPATPAKEGGQGPQAPSAPQGEGEDEEEVGPEDEVTDDDVAGPEDQRPQPAPVKPAPKKPTIKPRPRPLPQEPVGPAALNEKLVMEIKSMLADRVLNSRNRELNLQAARQIVNLEVIGNDVTKDLRVLVGLKNMKKRIALGGIRSQGKAELVQTEGPLFAPVRKNAEVRGILLCLDFQIKGRCFTSLIRLELGPPGHRATVYAISRKTNAALAIQLLGQNPNPAASKLLALFENTAQVREQRRRAGLKGSDICKSGVKNAIRSELVESYDIVHGGSNYSLSLLTCEREVIVLTSPFIPAGSLAAVRAQPIPLAAFKTPRLGSLIDILRNQARDGEIRDNRDGLNEKTANAKFNLQHAISEGKLTRFSESSGMLGVALQLQAGQRASMVQVTFKRRTLPMADARGVDRLLRANPAR